MSAYFRSLEPRARNAGLPDRSYHSHRVLHGHDPAEGRERSAWLVAYSGRSYGNEKASARIAANTDGESGTDYQQYRARDHCDAQSGCAAQQNECCER